jgi:hypothetical protein
MLTAPILVGDYVTLNGMYVPGGLFAVNNLLANVGLYTAPNIQRKLHIPISQFEGILIYIIASYLRSERAQAGIWSFLANAEVGETRGVAFTTDISIPSMFCSHDFKTL